MGQLLDLWQNDRAKFEATLLELEEDQRRHVVARLAREMGSQELPELPEDKLRLLWPDTFTLPFCSAPRRVPSLPPAKETAFVSLNRGVRSSDAWRRCPCWLALRAHSTS